MNLDPNHSKPITENWILDLKRILFSKFVIVTIGTLLSIVFIRLALTAYGQRASDDHTFTVRVFKPKLESQDSALSLPGNVEAIQQANLFAHVGGYLKKIYVDEGDRVKKDQLLADIDAPDVANEYIKLRAELSLKRVTQHRYKELLDERVISQQEFDNIDTAFEETKSRFDNASANMEFTHIKAPFAGSIARRNKYPGDLITLESKDQTPIFVLVNEDELRIVVNVPQSDLGQLKVGDLVDIHIDSFPTEVFHGSITRFDALLDSGTKTQRVLIDIPNQANKLHAGMFASVDMHFNHRENTLMVPVDAITQEGEQAFVFVVQDSNGKSLAKKIPVKVGPRDMDRVEVLSGLSPDQTVIRKGMLAIQDGTVITPIEEPAPTKNSNVPIVGAPSGPTTPSESPALGRDDSSTSVTQTK